MTQHLALVSPWFSIQVGDRLLTTREGGVVTPWDAYSNKTIILHAQDGMVTLSYAGMAFIDGTPTDEWLADVITGGLVSGPDGISGTRFGLWTRRLTTGGALAAIAEAIERRVPRQSSSMRSAGLEILVSGWTRTRRAARTDGPPRTMLMTLVFDRASRTCVRKRLATSTRVRHTMRSSRMLGASWSIGASVGVEETFARIDAALADGNVFTSWIAEDLLVDCMRTSAADPRGATIGTDLMSVITRPGLQPMVKVRYLRDVTRAQPRVAYYPWFIAPDMVVTPQMSWGPERGATHSIVRGNGEESQRELVGFEVIPPIPGPPGPTSWATQPRRRWP